MKVYIALLFKAGSPVDMRIYKSEKAAQAAYLIPNIDWVTITVKEVIS